MLGIEETSPTVPWVALRLRRSVGWGDWPDWATEHELVGALFFSRTGQWTRTDESDSTSTTGGPGVDSSALVVGVAGQAGVDTGGTMMAVLYRGWDSESHWQEDFQAQQDLSSTHAVGDEQIHMDGVLQPAHGPGGVSHTSLCVTVSNGDWRVQCHDLGDAGCRAHPRRQHYGQCGAQGSPWPSATSPYY
jgi:hypothetical protein